MVSSVFPNHMTTSLQLALFWILPHVNNVAAYRINFILDLTMGCFSLDGVREWSKYPVPAEKLLGGRTNAHTSRIFNLKFLNFVLLSCHYNGIPQSHDYCNDITAVSLVLDSTSSKQCSSS